jgi:Big-like domain-containing protein/leishmanolysin
MMRRHFALVTLSLGLLACSSGESFTAVPTTIDVVPSAVSFGTLGRVRTLRAVARDQRGDTIAGPGIQWSVGNGTVASVDGAGNVTALQSGATQVYATAQGSSGPIRDSAVITVTQVPAQLVKASGDQQMDTASGTLPAAVAVRVNDSLGHPVANVPVGFVVTQGGGSLSASADTTDVLGQASVLWTLGPAIGVNALSVTVAGSGVSGSPALFGATAVAAGSRPSVAAAAGDGQIGLVSFAVNTPPSVIVRGPGGSPLAGKSVRFAVTGGGGTVQGGTVVTDASGLAQVGAWSLTAGANALTATVQDTGVYIGNPVTFTATGSAAAYHIDVRFLVPTTPSRQAVFAAAASRWETLIFGDVPDFPLKRPAGGCGGVLPAIDETVDDIIIYAILDSIDGPGKILGQSGPCTIRGNGQPVTGVMIFDTADVAGLEMTGRFALVIEHEMGHVLGYGTTWDILGLLAGGGTTDSHFTGAQALAAFNRSGGQAFVTGSKVPVENCVGFQPGTCGAGTQDSHWRESVFKNELMTGFINNGANPLSVVTTASMGDLGYLVNYAGSDVYAVPTAPAMPSGTTLVLGDDIRRVAIEVVDATGRVVRTIAPR